MFGQYDHRANYSIPSCNATRQFDLFEVELGIVNSKAWQYAFDAYGARLSAAEKETYENQERACILQNRARGEWREIPSTKNSPSFFKLHGGFKSYQSLNAFVEANTEYYSNAANLRQERNGIVVAKMETSRGNKYWHVYQSANLLEASKAIFADSFKDRFNKTLIEKNSTGLFRRLSNIFLNRSEAVSKIEVFVSFLDLQPDLAATDFPSAEHFANDGKLLNIMNESAFELAVIRRRDWKVWTDVVRKSQSNQKILYR